MAEVPAFERDVRSTRLDTEVISVGEEDGRPFAVLADTVLYPEGGGQPADRGTVEGVPVIDVQRRGGEIRHVLAGPVPVGAVSVELDWPRRFDHMQQHTAQHLLTAVAHQRFGWQTTAFHLGDRVSDIELDVPEVSDEAMAELEEAVAVEIRAARPVTARRVSPDELADLAVRTRGLPEGHTGSVRLVEIEGLDVNTCGGTHCGSTAELEALKLLGTESMRGGARLFYAAGARLRRLHGAHHRRNAELRALLGASDDELVSRVLATLGQLKDAERAVRKLEEELASASAAALVAEPGPFASAHWPNSRLSLLQAAAREVGRLAPRMTVLLTCGEGEDGGFVIAAGEESSVDPQAVGPRVAELLAGRGGGSGLIFQGKVTRLSRREEAVALLRSLA